MKHLTEEQISALVDSSNNQNAEEINHIEICISCQIRYNQILKMHERLKSLEYQRPSMRFAKNIVEIIEQNKKLDKASMFWTRIISRGILVAVSLAFVMMVYWYMSTFDGKDNFRLIINQWNVIFLTTAGCSWLLYFFDNWLGKNLRKQV